MIAFDPANVPASITSVEEMFVWCGSILAEVAGNETIQTDRNTLEPVATVQTYRFANAAASEQERIIVAAYVPLTAEWRSAGRFWEGGIDSLSDAAIPAAYLT